MCRPGVLVLCFQVNSAPLPPCSQLVQSKLSEGVMLDYVPGLQTLGPKDFRERLIAAGRRLSESPSVHQGWCPITWGDAVKPLPFAPFISFSFFLFWRSWGKFSHSSSVLHTCMLVGSRGELNGNKCEGDCLPVVPWNEIPGGRRTVRPGTEKSVESKHQLWRLDKE